MFLTKFIYDLLGRPEPSKVELDEEIDRLLKIKGVELTTYKVPINEQDQISRLDSEVISFWLRRRFEPALILWVLAHGNNNYYKAKSELNGMERYTTLVDKFLRINFVDKRAMHRIRELCFDDIENVNLPQVLVRLRRALTFLSKHLEENHPDHLTLQGFEAYMPADELMYKYIKRILVGKYKDQGIRSHVNLCEPLKKFMDRFTKKNPYIQPEDSSANDDEENGLLSDLTMPVIVAMGFMLFYLWRKR